MGYLYSRNTSSCKTNSGVNLNSFDLTTTIKPVTTSTSCTINYLPFTKMDKISSKQPHICIIGGGAAGLSAGYFLKERGYTQITVLEKEVRVGGKCLSITSGGKSFDLGANYVTASYRQVKRLARSVGADMYTEGKLNGYDYQKNQMTTLLKAVSANSSMIEIGWQSLRFILKRWRLNPLFSVETPGYKNMAAHPAICQPFGDWLTHQNLPALKVLFQIPLSLMGYGQLTEIPTAYALTYLTIPTFLNLVSAALSPSILGYPKRFTEGYERLWQRLSWHLDVRVGAQVTQVQRGNRIAVTYSEQEERITGKDQNGPTLKSANKILYCDYLIIGVPLYADAIRSFLTDMSEQETRLFEQVVFDPFIVTTYIMPGLEAFTAATFMIPEPEIGYPFVVTRQFADNDLVSFYTRNAFGEKIDKETILRNNAAFVKKATGLTLVAYDTYSEFPYFPHVSSTAMAAGFYDQLEAQQGRQNTFYVGGLMNFELVETIVNYSRQLVATHFPAIKS